MWKTFKMWLWRMRFNFWPCYFGSGGWITYISNDYKHIRVKIPLNWRTRNYVNTIYGGSLYGAVDPFYMSMLMELLGPEYIVWDKSASIRFLKPGNQNLYADMVMTDEELAAIKNELSTQRSVNRNYSLELKDKNGKTYAIVEKTVYVARKR